ncbi:MAG: response regulator [Proteobacteria bacterium]|nr:response regulator [Pseudomonadota bacterium]
MSRSKSVLFPASRELFKVIRVVANNRSSSDRISDVEIGRAVGFESARTSRWKHGQIAVTDAPRLLALSQSFDIDISILAQVSAGYILSDEALEILANEGKFVRFVGEQIVLPADDQVISLTGGDGTLCRVIRRSKGHYHRRAKRLGTNSISENKKELLTVLLVDDDENTIEVFNNLTGAETGIDGFVARTGLEALIHCGKTSPDLIIFDVFCGQIDGFAAIKSIATSEITQDTEIFATSLSLTRDVVRTALGSGALEVLQKPLKSSVLSRLLSRVRRYV